LVEECNPEVKGIVMDKVTEFLGCALLVAFFWFVWPPLVLLAAGMLLVIFANTRTHTGEFGKRFRAARRAWLASREVEPVAEVRRIA
jgi:hypothetical protein